MFTNIYKKIITLALSLVIVGSSTLVPERAEAVEFERVAQNVLTSMAVCTLQSELGTMLNYILAPVESLTDVAKVPTSTAKSDTLSAAKASKECTLDYAANMLKQELLRGMITSTTQWVNGGFEGKPSFMTDPDQFLNDATDQYVANIIEDHEGTAVLCSNFRTSLKFAINLRFYGKSDQARIPTCTMSDIEQNIDNALGDLSNFYNQNGELNASGF